MSWVETNLELLRSEFDDLDYRLSDGVHWVRIPRFALPSDVWTVEEAEVAFRIPAVAGEAPYGFWVHPAPALRSGQAINNYTPSASTPWGSGWGQFSFAPTEPWQPKADIRHGPNMLRFARGIAERLVEGA